MAAKLLVTLGLMLLVGGIGANLFKCPFAMQRYQRQMLFRRGKWDSKYKKPIQCSVPPWSCPSNTHAFRTFDGSCNNLKYPGYGMGKSRHLRLAYPNYGDGKSSPSLTADKEELPNARELSLSLFGENTILQPNISLITMQWGQFVAHDMGRADDSLAPLDCCQRKNDPRCYPITLRIDDPIAQESRVECHDFSRATFDHEINCPPSGLPYSEKITVPTPYLDLSNIYGSCEEENHALRTHRGGRLRASEDGYCMPIKEDNTFFVPDDRQQMVPGICTLHLCMFRFHNWLADEIAFINPHYSDEQVFQLARKILCAVYQRITYYEYLPMILGKDNLYKVGLLHPLTGGQTLNDYNCELQAGLLAEFSVVAYRYLHNTITGYFTRLSNDPLKNETFILTDYFKTANTTKLLLEENSVDSCIRGLVTQPMKNSDGNIAKEIKYSIERQPNRQYGKDLKAMDIQRCRDFGVTPYNGGRVCVGLPKAVDWKDFYDVLSPTFVERLKKFYKCPDDVELSVGAAAERDIPGAQIGHTFYNIIIKQFRLLRSADRFFFENGHANGFNAAQLTEIRKVTLASLLCLCSDNLDKIQRNAFMTPSEINKPICCDKYHILNIALWKDTKKKCKKQNFTDFLQDILNKNMKFFECC